MSVKIQLNVNVDWGENVQKEIFSGKGCLEFLYLCIVLGLLPSLSFAFIGVVTLRNIWSGYTMYNIYRVAKHFSLP